MLLVSVVGLPFLVVLDFAAVDRFEIQRATQHERNLFRLAQITQPVSVKCRLAADDQVFSERFELLQKSISVSGMKVLKQPFLTVGIDDAGLHGIGMPIDSAVELLFVDTDSSSVSPLDGGTKAKILPLPAVLELNLVQEAMLSING